MKVFELRDRLVQDYASYTKSFIKIANPRIDEKVQKDLAAGAFWPEPLLQLNPTFRTGGAIEDLVREGVLHEECRRIFRADKSDKDGMGKPLILHAHQREAILKAQESRSYVLTSGTGSGKSLTYIVPIVDHVLRTGTGRGVQAIVVYPMNALANSQHEELSKFLKRGYPEGQSPVRFERYTGQETQDERERIRNNPPDILLTNYMMLELMLTRHEDRQLVRSMKGVRFLVFDELHTYRGRQGADVALLIRRCRDTFGDADTICVGTSATMASGGTTEDQRREVAKAAQTLFGVPFDATQVIAETLERATPERDDSSPEFIAQLKSALAAGGAPPTDFDTFCAHPLASWIESRFGIASEPLTGRLVRQRPGRLKGEQGAAAALANLTGHKVEVCGDTLKAFLEQGSVLRRSESSRFPVFAFRLHQFFTRGDTVWSTLEADEQRHLELSKLITKPGDPDKLMFPLVFCRHCGAEYFRIYQTKEQGHAVLRPREERIDDDDATEGFLYVSESSPWPILDSEQLDRLPDFIKKTNAKGVLKVDSDKKGLVPVAVHVNTRGELVPEGQGLRAAIIPGQFRFCLNPECKVVYAGNQRSERTKLATLGVDNRSTATTILAVRSLLELKRPDQGLSPEAQKLLSFTDNRQDASLQAGHFNDFTQVALIRSALFKAMQDQGAEGLSHGTLSRAVFTALQLPYEEYAADPDVKGPARVETHDALRDVLEYYLYRDLQRGWRVTAPNLEDCGLLEFDYRGLRGEGGLLEDRELWADGVKRTLGQNKFEMVPVPLPIQLLDDAAREEVLRTLVDVMRKGLAVKVDVLNREKQKDLIDKTKPRLQEGTVWYLEEAGTLSNCVIAWPRTTQKGDGTDLHFTHHGGYGRYLKRKLAVVVKDLKGDAIDECIRFLFLALKTYGIVEQVRGGETPGYQVNPGALIWRAGNGEVRPIDRTRLVDAGEEVPGANRYFVECYRRFVDLKTHLEAREHTAQVNSEMREKREEEFRAGNLPLLFCSPTMELGVDIAQLNVVNLRNVPPTPANYAQRSGRAGRGGQQALVFTYCAGRSPHDQYYFREPDQMVAGAVAPPRNDLRNRNLLTAHVHAIWMEVAKPDLGKTLVQVIDLDEHDGKLPLPVKEHLRSILLDPVKRSEALQKANRLVEGLSDELAAARWFHPEWTREVLERIEHSFGAACERWRNLYRAAVRQRELQHKIMGDPSRPEFEREQARRLRAQAESQLKLLVEADGVFEGDFYTYRYFASEGFLPGYNFPRLPLSAFVPSRRRLRGKDDFVSRPRFLAISEFGPRSLVYHEGARYRVVKVNLDFGSDVLEDTKDLATNAMKRCQRCGYAHPSRTDVLDEICLRCGGALAPESRFDHLVQMTNVTLRLAQRITCDEEERQRFGYRLVTAYEFSKGNDGGVERRDAEVVAGGQRVMSLSYGDATTLYRMNLGWQHQKNTEAPGFDLDLERGYWGRNKQDDKDADDATQLGRIQRVVPYVTDTKNALVVRMEPELEGAEMAALEAALREAILKHFQLESRELSSEPMPSTRERRELLFYEVSEGGAGVLRQLVEDPAVLPQLARVALEVCHFDPDTLEDREAERCGKACYRCLLDYGNQGDHRHIDRFAIRDTLAKLARSECRPAGGRGTREEHLAKLRSLCDSQLEKQWLRQLDELRLQLPSHAQHRLPNYYAQPDFYYDEHHAVIYVDGPPHDEPAQVHDDAKVTRELLELGYVVIRFHYQQDWRAIFAKHPDIFGSLQP